MYYNKAVKPHTVPGRSSMKSVRKADAANFLLRAAASSVKYTAPGMSDTTSYRYTNHNKQNRQYDTEAKFECTSKVRVWYSQ